MKGMVIIGYTHSGDRKTLSITDRQEALSIISKALDKYASECGIETVAIVKILTDDFLRPTGDLTEIRL